MAKQTARIEYTMEVRGSATRRVREISAEGIELGDVIDRTIDRLADKGGFNFDVRYEVAS